MRYQDQADAQTPTTSASPTNTHKPPPHFYITVIVACIDPPKRKEEIDSGCDSSSSINTYFLISVRKNGGEQRGPRLPKEEWKSLDDEYKRYKWLRGSGDCRPQQIIKPLRNCAGLKPVITLPFAGSWCNIKLMRRDSQPLNRF